MASLNRKKAVNYAKWGYFFIAPFFIIYIIFSLVPLLSTFYYSFTEYYRRTGIWEGPNWIGFENFKEILDFSARQNLLVYFKNTFLIWIIGFIPQIIVSLLLASWFTDLRLKLKGSAFFKVVIYLPNVIMAAAVSMLFFNFFGDLGPVNDIVNTFFSNAKGLMENMKDGEPFKFFQFFNSVGATRGIIAGINFLMWFGNTTILLLAAILGVDVSLYESAQIDGANATQSFWRITIPLIRPLMVYVFITSLIGGLQMFDIPNVMTNATGNPDMTSRTVVMYLNTMAGGGDYGRASAVAVILFIISAVLSFLIFWLGRDRDAVKRVKRGKGATLL